MWLMKKISTPNNSDYTNRKIETVLLGQLQEYKTADLLK